MDMAASSLHPHACSYIHFTLSDCGSSCSPYYNVYTCPNPPYIIWASESKIFAFLKCSWSECPLCVVMMIHVPVSECHKSSCSHKSWYSHAYCHTVILSYSHTVMESRVGTVALHVQVSPSRAIAHPLSQLVMDQGTFGHWDTYLSLTIDSAFKGHIDIIMNILLGFF